MDWEGQRLAEHLMQILLFAGGLVSFLIGFLLQSYSAMMYGQAVSIGLALLLTVPDWPFYNAHKRKWLDPAEITLDPTISVAELLNSKMVKKKGPAKPQKQSR